MIGMLFKNGTRACREEVYKEMQQQKKGKFWRFPSKYFSLMNFFSYYI